ncbi:SDO1-like protein C21C3.19 [Erysiphe neolycopersici]|uniref:SDO1-like protein C21C3.19 n=1 Tax=Erysiphe neolycopersici TaxID=212602 RepID=A0A420HXE9_9PEZI|nr:SDO1-like protein C21C3.19 [Erysiphe neolycopersici]
MGRGDQTKVHYKGKDDDFIIFIDDSTLVNSWKTDKSIPMAHFVSTFKVFVTHKHGAQGSLDTASTATLENEFGTSVVEDVIKKIIEKGSIRESEAVERYGSKNDTMGSRIAH